MSGLKLTPGMQDEKNVSGSPAREGSVPHLSQHTCGNSGGNARACRARALTSPIPCEGSERHEEQYPHVSKNETLTG